MWWGPRHSPLQRDQARRIFDALAHLARDVVLAGPMAAALQGAGWPASRFATSRASRRR